MKMKKIAAAMLATVMAVSLSACGAPTESTGASSEDTSDVQISTERTDNDTEQADPVTSATTSAVTEQTTTATTAPAEPEIPVEMPVINVEPTLVMNGCMAFKCDGKNYVYNITENELYETEYDVDDITVLKGCVAVMGKVDSSSFNNTNAYVVNVKTNETYDDVKPFYNSHWDNDYFVVGKLDKGFSESTISIGLLTDKGEWRLPLSTDYAVCGTENIADAHRVYQNNSYVVFDTPWIAYLYDINKDAVTTIADLRNGITVKGITANNIILAEAMSDSQFMVYGYDIITGERTDITDSYNLIDVTPSFVASQKNKNGLYEIYDTDYKLLNYDLSEYNFNNRFHEIKGVTENIIVFHAAGADENIYTVVQNKDGDFICDPITYDKNKMGSYDVYFSENKVIIKYNKANARIIDINTGAITEYDSTFDIIDYDDTNNLMLVNTNGAYYLVDPEDPDTLINPFERANN